VPASPMPTVLIPTCRKARDVRHPHPYRCRKKPAAGLFRGTSATREMHGESGRICSSARL